LPDQELPDPRWALDAREGLTAAMAFLLMTGEHAPARVRGWVQLAQDRECSADTMWAAHRESLIAAAAWYGFEPHRLTHRKPSGARFDAWRARFLVANTY
jgi:hypothetical protein